jgi:hypothetical protein
MTMPEIYVLAWRNADGDRCREWFATLNQAIRRMRKVDPDGGIITTVASPSGKRALVKFLNDHAR